MVSCLFCLERGIYFTPFCLERVIFTWTNVKQDRLICLQRCQFIQLELSHKPKQIIPYCWLTLFSTLILRLIHDNNKASEVLGFFGFPVLANGRQGEIHKACFVGFPTNWVSGFKEFSIASRFNSAWDVDYIYTLYLNKNKCTHISVRNCRLAPCINYTKRGQKNELKWENCYEMKPVNESQPIYTPLPISWYPDKGHFYSCNPFLSPNISLAYP